MNKRLGAFTIIEMLIVMLLSAIVVGLTYLYFNQFLHYIRNTEKASADYLTYDQFVFVFRKDLDNASEIYIPSTDHIQILSNDGEITYQLEEKSILRETETVTDSFRLECIDPDILILEKYNDLVQQVAFDIMLPDSNIVGFLYRKDYPAATLFNRYNIEN